MSTLPSGWASAPVTDFVAIHDNRRIPLNAKQREAMRGEYPYYGANGLVDHVNDYLFDGEYTLLDLRRMVAISMTQSVALLMRRLGNSGLTTTPTFLRRSAAYQIASCGTRLMRSTGCHTLVVRHD
jgi:hypothetical protein